MRTCKDCFHAKAKVMVRRSGALILNPYKVRCRCAKDMWCGRTPLMLSVRSERFKFNNSQCPYFEAAE